MAYIAPRVKLELGARGDPWPTEKKVICPYAAEDFPDFFKNPDSTVTVLSAQLRQQPGIHQSRHVSVGRLQLG